MAGRKDNSRNRGPEQNQGNYGERWQVPGPYKGVGPKNYQRSDDAICREVCELMAGSGQLDAGGIEVKVEDGEVILTGTVDSRPSKRLAEEIADSAYGVKDVRNLLRVRDAGGKGARSEYGSQQV